LKSAGVAGADDLEMNLEPRTSNAEHRKLPRAAVRRRWTFEVRSSIFAFCLAWLVVPHVFGQANTNALPALVPAYGELPTTFWEQHQSTIIVAGFALLAVAFLFLRVWLRPETPMVLPSEVQARQSLARLQNQPEDGNVLSGASQILRRYAGETFNLPDTGLTTAEFCSALERHPQLGSELASALSSFLRECDVRKFSPANPAAPLNAVSRALELIATIETRRSALATQTSATK
jgi:hypothetical protein